MTHEKDESHLSRREFLGTTAKAAAAVTVAGMAPTLSSGCSTTSRRQAASGYDILIQNGSVYDGTGAAPVVADIGIRGDRIAAVGRLEPTADKIIDARGLVVTPGFIDVHTHCDLTFKRTGLKRYLAYLMPSWKGNYNYLYQGVSTVVTGNCGYGYTDTAHWYDIVKAVGFGTNVAHLVPHGIVREKLFGVETQPKALTRAQLDRMRGRIAEEMEKGAFGMSTGLEYAPGCLTDTDELIALARVVRQSGGLYTSHIRDESGRLGSNGQAAVVNSIEEAIRVARSAEISVEISHLKISAPIGSTPPAALLETIEKARLEGLDVHADQYPYAAGSTVLSFLAPNRMKTAKGLKAEFRTAEGKKQVAAAIQDVFAYAGPEKILITMYAGHEEYEGKTLQTIAEMEGRPASASYADMVCEEEPPMAVFFFQDMAVVKSLAPHDYIITASDGWTIPRGMSRPHPRVYGTFPRKLGRFVLEDRLMELPMAIRSMTGLPAEKFAIKDRGRITAGCYADIAVIDFGVVGDHATYTDPHQYSTGIRYLLVNGEVSIEQGAATGRRAGRPLLRG